MGEAQTVDGADWIFSLDSVVWEAVECTPMATCDLFSSDHINVLSTAVIAFATVGSVVMTKAIRDIERRRDKANVMLWFEEHAGPRVKSVLINTGTSALAIRRIRVTPETSRTVEKVCVTDDRNKASDWGSEVADFVVLPNVVYYFLFEQKGGTEGNFGLEIQYYSGEIQLLQVDTARRGPYPVGPDHAIKATGA